MMTSFIQSPRIILADAINFPMVIGAGLFILVPVTIFVVFVEAFVISKMLRYSFKETVKFTFIANLLSALAGIPTMLLNEWIFSVAKPHDLADYFASYLGFSILATSIYFAVSVLIEFTWGLRWRRRRSISVTKPHLLYSIVAANLVSYAVLAPLHYRQSKPSHNIREFTHDSSWANHPTTTIIYVDSVSNWLMRIESDGSHKEALVAFPLRDYIVSSDLKTYLFRGVDGNLYYHDVNQKNSLKIWETKSRFLMDRVAFSPSGGKVAYLSPVKEIQPYRLVLYDVAKKSALQTEYVTAEGDYHPQIAWSANETDLYIRDNKKLRRLSIADNGIGSIIDIDALSTNGVVLSPSYGRFGIHWWGGGDDWGVVNYEDKCQGLTASTLSGLESEIEVTKGEETVIRLSDNPGLLHIGRRSFGEPSFIDNCQECVFEDGQSLYLLDVQDKRIGKIADGYRHVLLTDSYQREKPLIQTWSTIR
jgi:hypothetical protein